MKTAFLFLSFALVGSRTVAAFGQAPNAAPRGAPPPLAVSKDATGVSVSLQSLAENRVAAPARTNNGTTSLAMVVSGPGFAPGSIVRQVTASVAVDDTGLDLLPAADAPRPAPVISGLTMTTLSSLARGQARPLAGNATIAVAGRDATAIKSVEGAVEILAPSEANGSLIVVKEIGKRVGKPIEELAKYGIEFTLITPDTWAAVQQAIGVQVPTPPNFANGPVFFVRDPKSVLVGCVFRDAGGNPFQTAAISTRGLAGGILYEMRLQAGSASPDSQIALYVAVPEAISTVDFKFENIALP